MGCRYLRICGSICRIVLPVWLGRFEWASFGLSRYVLHPEGRVVFVACWVQCLVGVVV